MATMVFTDAKILIGGYDVSGLSNEINLSISPEMLDESTFGTITKKHKAGLDSFKADAKGFMDFALNLPPAPHPSQTQSLNEALYARIGASDTPFTVAPLGNAEDDVAWIVRGVNGKFEPIGGSVGNLMPFAIDVNASGTKAVRGFVMGRGTKSATGNSAAGHQFVGGVAAGKYLYASLHVVAAAGSTPTLDAIVQSDDNSGFSSATTRLTFPQFTTSVGASWQQLAGPITDDYYRLRWTIAGGSPQYTIFGVIGIG